MLKPRGQIGQNFGFDLDATRLLEVLWPRP